MAQFKIAGCLLDGTTGTNAPSRQDLTFPAGEDVVFSLTVTGVSGAAINITGYSGVMLWKVTQSGPSTPVSLSLPLSLTAPTSGQGTFTLTAGQSKLLYQTAGNYFYDVVITSGSGAKDEVIPTSLITMNYAVGLT